MEANQFIHGDCFQVFPNIPDHSIDLILADLPYGTTSCAWDSILPINELWKHYKRVLKPNGAVVLTASQPFTSALVMSNPTWFKHEWIWNKRSITGFVNAKYCPLKQHESVLIFCEGKSTYNPQGLTRINKIVKPSPSELKTEFVSRKNQEPYVQEFTGYPKSIIEFKRECGLHPTQKPVPLFEYLIKTYSNEGETVLDNTAGVATTAIACIRTNRNYICIEQNEDYYNKAKQRIENENKIKVAV